MPRKKKSVKKPIEQYEHRDKERLNNPPVGLVSSTSDKYGDKTTFSYDPHLDPQLVWAGKAEHTSFDVQAVSLHVHERIDPKTVIDAVRKKNGQQIYQTSLFESSKENPPLREAIEFYKHAHGWSNRLIAGDSLLVMNSLLEKEGMAGKVQMIYIDPPYGIKYGSNFQPFVNKRDVKDGKDEDLSQEPEMIKAFRDTWELGIHSYLSYMRDRLLLGRELLHESGSIFVQISDENLHMIRNVLDGVFGPRNFLGLISFRTATGQPTNFLSSLSDYLIWYARDISKAKFRRLLRNRSFYEKVATFGWIEEENGISRSITAAEKRGEIPLPQGKLFKDADLTRKKSNKDDIDEVVYNKKKYKLPNGLRYIHGIERIVKLKRVIDINGRLCGKRYEKDNPLVKLSNIWEDTVQGTFELTRDPKRFVVQTAPKVIQRCLIMTTDPGDLVLDTTCGSGTTSFVAEQWGRRWITCDTSRVAITLAKQRLMTALFDYYELSYPNEGVGSGFKYDVVQHKTLVSIANNEPSKEEPLYDKPLIDNSRARVTGPFTVEAVPAPVVKSLVIFWWLQSK